MGKPATTAEQPPAPRASRRVATLWNLVFQFGTQGLFITRNLLLVPLYLHFIHPNELYGAWLASGGVIQMLTALDFGLSGVLSQQAAAAFGSRADTRLAGVVGSGLVVALIISLSITGLSVALSPWMGAMFGLSGIEATSLNWCFLIASVANGFHLFVYALGSVLNASQRPFWPQFWRFMGELISVLSIAALLYAGWGLYAIATGLAVRSGIAFLGNAGAFVLVAMRRLGVRLAPSRHEALRMLRLSLYQFVAQFTIRTKFTITPFFVGLVLGPGAALIYGLTTRAHDTVRLLSAVFAASVIPSMSHLYGEGDRERFRQVFGVILRIQGVCGAIGFGGVLAYNASFVTLWVGADNYAGFWITALASAWGVFYLLGTVVYDTLFCMGQYPTMCRLNWIEAVIRIPLTFVMLWAFGLWGALAALLLGQVVFINGWMSRIVFEKLGLSGEAERAAFARAARTSAPVIGLALVRSLLPQPTTWFWFAGDAALFALVCLGIVAIVDPSLPRLVRARGRLPVDAGR